MMTRASRREKVQAIERDVNKLETELTKAIRQLSETAEEQLRELKQRTKRLALDIETQTENDP
ncbi:MAG: hypothetical protein HY234_15665 [Acidobacteria bacterium]|nr:hypothetical protein [Acidobacteriota bacterium]MBI3664472.1 hypothetical protein [Acidobacteriota bacterium]